ncbi:hypothetical protein CH63R_04736 [Colletotrichum higginsianum IMI 349063]|uniref:Secreted protein n=1 Tax=Colletotrichum higginsianum (strain IMI 349063) TaxID=759273 RepID=A0A1B7YK78_COLHI|nr:hypothetical protein CH63R_04736 [Colletotrichum higginsianum IMI 349063]OBR12440.1 hypothetical protein CH63R_04736 [Colletotrichum higginsianum IMI 349063]
MWPYLSCHLVICLTLSSQVVVVAAAAAVAAAVAAVGHQSLLVYHAAIEGPLLLVAPIVSLGTSKSGFLGEMVSERIASKKRMSKEGHVFPSKTPYLCQARPALNVETRGSEDGEGSAGGIDDGVAGRMHRRSIPTVFLNGIES